MKFCIYYNFLLLHFNRGVYGILLYVYLTLTSVYPFILHHEIGLSELAA